MASKRAVGRPPRSGKAALERVELRLTKPELRAWRQVAKERDMSVSEFLRLAVDALTGRPK